MCKIFRTFAAEMKNKGYLYALYALFLLAACADKKPQQELTPWGTPVGEMEHADNSDGLMVMKRNQLQPARGFRSKIFRPMVSSSCLPLTALLPIMITAATEWDCNICSARSLPSRSACRYA